MSFEKLDRITQTPGVMGGKPCIRGMRITVSRIVSQLSAGDSIEQILLDYPSLEWDDVLQSLAYAAIMSSGSYAALKYVA